MTLFEQYSLQREYVLKLSDDDDSHNHSQVILLLGDGSNESPLDAIAFYVELVKYFH